MEPTTTYTRYRESDLVVWAVFLVAPFALYPWALGSGLSIDSDTHRILSIWASVSALTAGFLVLVHYFANGSWFFLMISIAFLLQGCEDMIGLVLSVPMLGSGQASNAAQCIHVCGNLFPAVIILAAFFVRKKYTEAAKRPMRVLKALAAAAVLAVVFSKVLSFLPFDGLVFPSALVKRPLDLVIGVVYLAAFFLYVRAYRHREFRTPFVYSMIGSIAFGLATQVYMVHCLNSLDAQHVTSMAIQIAGTLFPVFGIAIGTFWMYRKQAQMTKEIGDAFERESRLAAKAAAAEVELAQKDELARALDDASQARDLAKKEAAELERINRVMVGRELKMTELKKRIAELEGRKEEG